MIEKLPF